MLYKNLTFYLSGSKLSGSNFMSAPDSRLIPSVPGALTTGTGFTVAQLSSGSYAGMTGSATANTASFRQTIAPSGSLNSSFGDAWIIGPLMGSITSGSWEFTCSVLAGFGTGQRGNLNLRFWKGSSVNGSNATVITSSVGSTMISTSLVTVGTGTETITSGSFPITSSIMFSNEYMFIQAAWAITGTGSLNTSNVRIRQGSSSLFTTANSNFEDNTFIILDDSFQ